MGDAKLHGAILPLQFNENIFLSHSQMNSWDWSENQVRIKMPKKSDPLQGDYSIQYTTSKQAIPAERIREQLTGGHSYGYIQGLNDETLRVSIFPLKNRIAPTSGVSSAFTVKKGGNTLGNLSQPWITTPRVQNRVYPPRNSGDSATLKLTRNDPQFQQSFRIKPGHYSIAVWAKSAGRNNDASPEIVVKANGIQIGHCPIHSEDYAMYFFSLCHENEHCGFRNLPFSHPQNE